MPLNPNIALAGQGTDLIGNLARGFQTGSAIRNQPIIEELQQQRLAQGEQALTQGQQAIETGDLANTEAKLKLKNSIVSNIAMETRLQPPEQRVEFFNNRLAEMGQEHGFQFPQAGISDLTDDSLTEIINQMSGVARTPPSIGFGASNVVKDEEGNLFNSTQRRNPQTGEADQVLTSLSGDPSITPVGDVQAVNSQGMTPSELQEFEAESLLQQRNIEIAVNQGNAAFDMLPNIDNSIAQYNEVIQLLDEGANTGAIASRLPSFRQASIALDNVRSRLGLTVIQSATFGALSESEMNLALDTALPTGLNETELKEWAINKRNAQMKLRQTYSQAAQFLTQGGTIAEWIDIQSASEQNQPQMSAQDRARQELENRNRATP